MLVASLAAALVFGLWYPGAFLFMAGGRDLFFLVAAVDVVMGPVLTFAVFDRQKGLRHLRRDLAVIGLLQLAALAYGLHTVYVARPVAMVFEVDRFRLVTANDVHKAELPAAPAAYRSLPWTGPWLLAARRPQAGAERTEAMFMGAAGIDVGQRPRFWQPYEASRAIVKEKSRPFRALLDQYVGTADDLAKQAAALGADPSTARFLPVMARGDWVAVLGPDADVLGYLPVDGFF